MLVVSAIKLNNQVLRCRQVIFDRIFCWSVCLYNCICLCFKPNTGPHVHGDLGQNADDIEMQPVELMDFDDAPILQEDEEAHQRDGVNQDQANVGNAGVADGENVSILLTGGLVCSISENGGHPQAESAEEQQRMAQLRQLC